MDVASTPAIASTASARGFRVQGYVIASPAWADATTLRLNLVEKSVPDTGAVPSVSYNGPGGGARAVTGSEVVDATIPSMDRAGPVLRSFLADDRAAASMFNAIGDAVILSFSEPAALAGASSVDRWTNLERAVRFTNDGGGCPADGTGGVTPSNFPQPGTGVDPIDAPAAREFASTWRVSLKQGNGVPPSRFVAVPVGCWAGIDPLYDALVTDEAGNAAADQDLPSTGSRRVRIYPAEAGALVIRTVDGNAGAPDGKLDAVEVYLNQLADDATLAANLKAFTVTLDGKAAAIASTFDTGAATNDSVFVLPFAPSGSSWDTGKRPVVSYRKPSSCSYASGAGVKTGVPTPGYVTCLGSFTVESADAAPPLLLGAATGDADADGLIDRVRATFSEAMATGSKSGWSIAGFPAAAFAIDAGNPRAANVDFAEGGAGTGFVPQVRYARPATGATADAAGNQLADKERTATDGAPPRVKAAGVHDLDGDGRVERVVLEYTEEMPDPAAAAAAGFTVGGVKGTGFAAGSSDADPGTAGDRLLSLVLPEVPGTDAKDVSYDPAATKVRDGAGNVAATQAIAREAVVDFAAPRARISFSPSMPLRAGTATMTADFSEPMNAAVKPTAVLGARAVTAMLDADHPQNGWRLDDPSVWEGTVAVNPNDCAVATGCAVTAAIGGGKDARGNTQPIQTLDTEVDTVAPPAPVVRALSARVVPGESVPAGMINMFTNSFTVAADIAPGLATDGTAEILLDGMAMSPPARDSSIGGGDGAVTPTTTFASRSDLQAAVREGTHALTVRLCDDAGNCAVSAESIGVTADYTPVAVTLAAPHGGEVVAGGSSMEVTWAASVPPLDFHHVELFATTNGTSYAPIAGNRVDPAGTYAWTTPRVDTAVARVRAVSVDANRNKALATSEPFVIDSTAPVVAITAPASSFPFVPAGGQTTVRWKTTDASVDRAVEPIAIEWSADRGATWQPVNDGIYSHASDGAEAWTVPAGNSFAVRLRVSATDALGRKTTVVSPMLAKGVAGYVADSAGRLYRFGTAPGVSPSRVSTSSDWVRGATVRGEGDGGYVLDSRGYPRPFSVGDAAMPASPSFGGFGGDRARGLALVTDTSGYVLSHQGRLYPWGGAPAARLSASWSSDLARGIVMLPSKAGGYVLDAYGRLYPFAVGSNAMPPSIQSKKLFSTGVARAFALRSNQRSGWVLDQYGKLTAFGGAPARASSGTGTYAYAKSLVLVTDDGGYWLNGSGVLRPWGSAFGIPSTTTLPTNRARAAASLP